MLLKGKNIISRSVGFADWFVEFKRYSNSHQNRSKTKLFRENSMTRTHGGCSLQVMGSWRSLVFMIQTLRCLNIVWTLSGVFDIASQIHNNFTWNSNLKFARFGDNNNPTSKQLSWFSDFLSWAITVWLFEPGLLEEDYPITMFFENKRFSSFVFAKRPITFINLKAVSCEVR